MWSGCRRDATQPQRAQIISDPVVPVRNLVGKHLSQNQVLGERTCSRSEPANEEPAGLHQLLHQRLRTTTNVLGPGHEDKARPWTTSR